MWHAHSAPKSSESLATSGTGPLEDSSYYFFSDLVLSFKVKSGRVFVFYIRANLLYPFGGAGFRRSEIEKRDSCSFVFVRVTNPRQCCQHANTQPFNPSNRFVFSICPTYYQRGPDMNTTVVASVGMFTVECS